MSYPLIEIRGLSKTFPKESTPALKNINANVSPGKIVGLVGPDGAGKTTLMRLLAALLLPTEGEIFICGLSTQHNAEKIHEKIGYMPQKFGLYEDLTVMQNLNLYANLRGLPKHERQFKYDELLEFTGLAPFINRLAGALSGGMKQKLGLACALIRKPEVLLLDEPSVGVDPLSRRELWIMVRKLISQHVTVIWSTAYLDEAERCDEVLLLSEGTLLFNGKPSDLTQKIEGRSFLISHISTRKRIVLVQALNENAVVDGVIQGDNVRIVLKNNDPTSFDLSSVHAGPQAFLQPVQPRFEDAFVDILGGAAKGGSPLAASTPVAETKSTPVVEAIGLTKYYGSFLAADNVTFKIPSGEIFGLLGPNGAGKSTTFKMMCGLLKPTKGEAFVNGLHLQTASSEARGHIGYMAQKFSLYGDLSVYQNLQFFSGIYNLTGSRRSDAIEKMIETFSLQPYLDISANVLPLGFKQRLALSCAVMHHPQVLFLDEPTSGVDPLTRREFWNHINGLVEKNITVMVTTHFMDEAEYCDRIALIYRGKIIKMGSPDELKNSIASKNMPSPTLEEAFIELIRRYDDHVQV